MYAELSNEEIHRRISNKYNHKNVAPKLGFLCFKKKQKWENQPDRIIQTNIVDPMIEGNKIDTSKYNAFTFIPINLFEQFSQLANVYFLIIALMQSILEISNSDGKPVILLPLTTILVITAIKDLFEDLKRHRSDNEENSKPIWVWETDKFVKKEWRDIKVGQVIKVEENEYFPADLLLMKTSNPKGTCYVETKNLDGETNLKHKFVQKELITYFKKTYDCAINPSILHYEKPNPFLYSFTGTMEIYEEGREKMLSLDQTNFVLRGSSLRNTQHIIGLVAYTGHESKIMLNSVKARPKMSKVQSMMNKEVLIVFFVQIAFCLTSSLWHALWYENNREEVFYLGIHPNENNDRFIYNFLVRYGNWMLLFTNFVPISLLVTLEMVKFLQGIGMTRDKKMISAEGIAPVVQSSTLNEELGQVECIFSDKTGTLTCNQMEFKNFFVGGTSFGDNRGYHNLSSRPKVTNVDFADKHFFDIIENPKNDCYEEIQESLIFLALCHSIIVEEKNGKIEYNCSSPDELALVNFAKFAGYELLGELSPGVISIFSDIEKRKFHYKLLDVLEFSSSRKRMSVIIQNDIGEIWLFTKGADSVILGNLSKNNLMMKGREIEVARIHIDEYSKRGLRTLVLAKRKLSSAEYSAWKEEYNHAATAMQDRSDKIEACQLKIETNFEFLAATAIEDKLQNEVDLTISALKEAGIKIWVLTGDKVETAINIGYSTKLLNEDYELILINGSNLEETIDGLRKGNEKLIQNLIEKKDSGLIVTGDALRFLLESTFNHSKQLIDVAERCKAVLACRVSPKQKRDIVEIFKKKNPSKTTLAIGDGANDVNMITAAHVGIGIHGIEGQQAARASDYSIGEFKMLRRLLLYHGRESYRKNTTLINYNFYKNLVLVLPQFWFGVYSGFSAQFLYDTWIFQLFNIFFTSMPIVVYALLDKERSAKILVAHPYFYIQGIKCELFNAWVFWRWFIAGALHAGVIMNIGVVSTEENFHDPVLGTMDGIQTSGMLIFGAIILVVNLKILTFSNTMTFFSILVMALSVLSYYIILAVFSQFPGAAMHQIIDREFGLPNSYITTIVILGFTSVIDIAFSRWSDFSYQRKIKMLDNLKNENLEEQYPLLIDS